MTCCESNGDELVVYLPQYRLKLGFYAENTAIARLKTTLLPKLASEDRSTDAARDENVVNKVSSTGGGGKMMSVECYKPIASASVTSTTTRLHPLRPLRPPMQPSSPASPPLKRSNAMKSPVKLMNQSKTRFIQGKLDFSDQKLTLPTPIVEISEPKLEFSAEQQVILSAVQEKHSVFITGGAGTGKSALLQEVYGVLCMTYRVDTVNDAVYMTATTGLAACNIGGSTLHSFLGVSGGVSEDCDAITWQAHMTRYTVLHMYILLQICV
jgi:hypothetical protein